MLPVTQLSGVGGSNCYALWRKFYTLDAHQWQLAWNNSNLFCSSDWVTHTCVKLRSFRWESSFTYPEAKLTKILKNAVTVIVGVIKWSDWFSLVTWCRLTNQIPECHSVSLHCLFENEPNHDFYWGSFTTIAEIEDLNHFRIYSNLTHYLCDQIGRFFGLWATF